MEAKKIKIILIIAFFVVVGIVSTCQLGKRDKEPEPSNSDTLFLSQWRREKLEKQKLIIHYENRIKDLQVSADSLGKRANETKQVVLLYRSKEKRVQDQLKQSLADANMPEPEKNMIIPFVDSLIVAGNQSDTACDATINNLEGLVANRDSVIALHGLVEKGFKDIQEKDDLKDQYLTDQLNTALKAQHKTARHNKLLSASLLLLGGFAASVLIIHPNR